MGRSSSKREEIYAFLKDYIASHGYPPTTREIMAGGRPALHGLRALSPVGAEPQRAPSRWTAARTAPFRSGLRPRRRACRLIGRRDGRASRFSPWKISRAMCRGEAEAGCFALRVRGDSMIEAGIFDGDKVVVRPQQTAENGEIVVALLGDSATVKRLRRRGGEVWLMPENPAYDPIDGRGAQILGKVKAVIREY